MKLIIGLGNPEKKYQFTRHNLGREMVKKWQKRIKSSDFKLKKGLKSLVSESRFGRQKIILALPQTFMNDSGKAAKSLTINYRLQSENIFVIHDDVDLPLGKIRISKRRGAASHRGVQSIIEELKTKNFIRFRIGIRPEQKTAKSFGHVVMGTFVLKEFTKEEQEVIKKSIKKCIEALELTLKSGLEKAMNEFNK